MHVDRFAAVVSLVVIASVASAQRPAEKKPERPAIRPVAAYSGHGSEVTALAFAPGGDRIVSVSSDRVCSWGARDGKEITRAAIESGRRVAIRADGDAGARLATSERSPARVVIRDVESGAHRASWVPHDRAQEASAQRGGFRAAVRVLAFSPDGQQLATAGTSWLVGGGHGHHGGEVKLWNAETGELIRQFGTVREATYRYHDAGVERVRLDAARVRSGLSTSTTINALAFCPAGEYVAVGTHGAGGELPESGEVRIWRTTTGEAVRTIVIKHIVPQGEWSSSVKAVALSRDGKRVAAALAGRRNDRRSRRAVVRVWDVETGREVIELRGHETSISSMAFGAAGRWLAAAGRDQNVRIWDVETGKGIATLPFRVERINTLAFSSDGKRLAAGGGDGSRRGRVRVWSCAH